jgi:hypothetical protein
MKEAVITEKKLIEKQEISLAKKMFSCSKRVLFGRSKELTADQANIISRFNLQGWPLTLDEIAEKKVREIEEQITSKLQFSHKEKLLALIVPEDQRDLYDIVKYHYEKKGFKTFYLDKERVPEFKNSTYLFISWDIDIR